MNAAPDQALRTAPGVKHVFNNWSRTPSIAEQLVIDGRDAPLSIEGILRLLDFVRAEGRSRRVIGERLPSSRRE
jgi:hypothetical protein